MEGLTAETIVRTELALDDDLVIAVEDRKGGERREEAERWTATIHAVLRVLTNLTQEEAEVVAGALSDLPERGEEQANAVDPITGRAPRSRAEVAALRTKTLIRDFEARRNLLEDALTSGQVAGLLGVSRPTPGNRVQANTLLALMDQGALRFPLWQFDPSGEDGVVTGFAEVLQSLVDLSPFAKLVWFTRENPYLEDRAPIDALREGDRERVLTMAEGLRRA